MIVDCHGHYTTAPAAHQKFRDQQIARLKDVTLPPAKPATIGDDEIRETIEVNQLKLQRQRGADLTLFSPRASAMAHHIGDEAVVDRDQHRADLPSHYYVLLESIACTYDDADVDGVGLGRVDWWGMSRLSPSCCVRREGSE
jgi:hypothetical protein